MVTINTKLDSLKFLHFVALPEENAIFGCAKDIAGRLYTFLISLEGKGNKDGNGGFVKEQQRGHWQELPQHIADTIRAMAKRASQKVPVFTTGA